MITVKMKCIILIFFHCLVLARAGDIAWRGMDVSQLPLIEQAMVDTGELSFWYEGTNTRTLPEILSHSGVNLARLRIFHTPSDTLHGLDYNLELAMRLKQAGIDGILLNFHFSDMYADSTQQTKPSSWDMNDFDELIDKVEHYTREVMDSFLTNGINIVAVQLGNDITSGLVWPDGRVGIWPYNTEAQWANLGTLLQLATNGIRVACNDNSSQPPKIVLHLSNGGDNALCRWFFDSLVRYYDEFDVIGVSYFSWWHADDNTMESLWNNLSELSTVFNKDVAIVETSYPWTLEWFDETNNPVGSPDHLLDGFPATIAGQRHYLSYLRLKLAELPSNHGIGLIYQDPEWIPTHNIYGSPSDNLALFNFWGLALRGLEVFSPSVSLPDSYVSTNLNLDVKWHGVDVSYLTKVEDAGGYFADASVPETLAINGINIVRLRIFHTPEDGIHGLEYTLKLAKRMHEQGMEILLAIHCSDTWADPEFQRKPASWIGLGIDDLEVSVKEYTKSILEIFIDEGVPPVAVQLGNEITTGFIYPEGRVGDEYNTPQQWSQFRSLLRKAISGTKLAFEERELPTPKIILHHSRSGGTYPATSHRT